MFKYLPFLLLLVGCNIFGPAFSKGDCVRAKGYDVWDTYARTWYIEEVGNFSYKVKSLDFSKYSIDSTIYFDKDIYRYNYDENKYEESYLKVTCPQPESKKCKDD